jgi:hypothetical protein
MNHQLWAFIALDLTRQRVEEIDRYHFHVASLAQDGQPSQLGGLRRSIAHGLAAFSRGSAAIVRKLDGCIADDLGRSLARTE